MPVISERRGYLFILSPRTGSSAIAGGVLIPHLDGAWVPQDDITDASGTKVLVAQKHAPVRPLVKQGVLERAEAARLLKFSAIRNPFDSMASLYVKQRSTYQPLLDDPDSWVQRRPQYKEAMTIAATGTFGEWLRHVLRPQTRRQRLLARTMGTYYPRHLYGSHIRGVDVVMRYETLQQDFDSVLRRLGLSTAEIPRENVTTDRADGYREYYDTSTRRFAERVFRPDMVRFGYRF